jgi:hypothetical protein
VNTPHASSFFLTTVNTHHILQTFFFTTMSTQHMFQTKCKCSWLRKLNILVYGEHHETKTISLRKPVVFILFPFFVFSSLLVDFTDVITSLIFRIQQCIGCSFVLVERKWLNNSWLDFKNKSITVYKNVFDGTSSSHSDVRVDG